MFPEIIDGFGWQLYVIAAFLIALGAAIQGGIGIGFGMFAAPFLALVEPRLVPGTVLMLGFFVAALIMLRERHHVDMKGLGWSLGGRLAGTVVAGATVALVHESVFGVLFALMILMGIGLSIIGWRLLPTRPNLIGAGILSGYMGTITSAGAPPMALVYQHRSGPTIRATMGAFLAVGAIFSVIALALAGRFGLMDLVFSVLLVPPMLFGTWVSRYGMSFVDRGRARTFVLALTAVAALVLLVRSLIQL